MKYANIFQRFIGALIDLAITFPVALLIHTSFVGVNSLASQLIFMLIEGFYYIMFWRTKRSTIGMMAMKVRIYSENGVLTINQALYRYLGIYLSAICLGIGAIWMLWDRNKQTWQDKIAKTYVIKV
jgi:uncharacterized RDD family membrane protein YckC